MYLTKTIFTGRFSATLLAVGGIALVVAGCAPAPPSPTPLAGTGVSAAPTQRKATSPADRFRRQGKPGGAANP